MFAINRRSVSSPLGKRIKCVNAYDKLPRGNRKILNRYKKSNIDLFKNAQQKKKKQETKLDLYNNITYVNKQTTQQYSFYKNNYKQKDTPQTCSKAAHKGEDT